MSGYKILKGLNFRQVLYLLGWFLKHPLFMFATTRATLATYKISQQEFPDIHGQLNKANAFRHALWNLLIAKRCLKYSRNLNKILNWTEKITHWHEEFSPNEPLARAMDLHNNHYGRCFFKQHQKASVTELKLLLLQRLNDAVLISDIQSIRKTREMVYIEH